MSDRGRDGTFAKGNQAAAGRGGKGLAALIKAQTNDGGTIVSLFVKVHLGEPVSVMRGGSVVELEPDLDQMLAAGEWLADRGWGKATQSVEHTGADGEALQVVVRSYRDAP